MSRDELRSLARASGCALARGLRKDELVELLRKRLSRRPGSRRPKPSDAAGEARVPTGDRVIAMVRDPHWLHVFWELSPGALNRCRAALGADWHGAKPALRLVDVTCDDTTGVAESVVREEEVATDASHWYLSMPAFRRRYRVDLGYRTDRGRFFALARSNHVRSPAPDAHDQIDAAWRALDGDCERVFAMSGGEELGADGDSLRALFEERLRRPLSHGSLADFGSGALAVSQRGALEFEIEAELIVYGRTSPNARVALQNQPIAIRPDGSFTVRFSLPEGRQIIPAVAHSNDGLEERMIILALERNTKALDPLIHNGQEVE